MKDFYEDFKDNWNNSYWWADHQWLMAAVSALVVGGVSLGVKYAEIKMEQTMLPKQTVAQTIREGD